MRSGKKFFDIQKIKTDLKEKSLDKEEARSLFLFKLNLKSILCIIGSVALNQFGRWMCFKLNAPAWGDFGGTALSAIVYGPIAGALVGILSNLLNGITGGSWWPDMLYAIVAAVSGFVIGYTFPREKKRTDPFTVSVTGFYATIAAVATSVPLNIILYDGYTGNEWGDAMADFLSTRISLNVMIGLLSEGFIDFPDKMITVALIGGLYLLFRKLMRQHEVKVVKRKRKERARSNIANAVALAIIGSTVLSCALPLFHAEASSGEQFASEYSAIHYDVDDGLSSLEMNDIVQTDDGYIWVGGYSGLYRCEGNKFFRMELGEGITSVTVLYIDSKGNMWIGTNDIGVAKYSPMTGEVKLYDLSWGLTAESVRSIVEDSDGIIYVGTVSAMATISPSGIVGILDTNNKISNITSMAADNSGNVVGVTDTGVLFLARGGRLLWTGECDQTDRFYTSVAVGNKGNVIVGTSLDTVERYRIVNEVMTRMESVDVGDFSYINDLKYDDVYKGYFVCAENGFGFVDEGTHLVTDLTRSDFDNSVTAVTFDYQDNVWFTSNKQGVMKFARKPFTELMRQSGLDSGVVNAVYKRGSELFIGADSGLYVIDAVTGKQIKYDYLKEFKDVRVRHIMEDSKFNLWISTYGTMGLVRISPNDELTYFNSDEKDTLGTRYRQAIELSTGEIVGATNQGLNFIKGDELSDTIGIGKGLNIPRILTMVEDDEGRLLCGSDGDGIYVVENGLVVDHIDATDGLRSLVVLRIVPLDDGGYLYVTSNAIYYDSGSNIKKLENFPYSNNYDVIISSTDVAWIASSAGFYIVQLEDLLADKPGYGYELLNYTRGFENSLCSNSWSLYDNHLIYACCSDGVEVIDTLTYNSFSSDYMLGVSEVLADDKVVVPSEGRYEIPMEASHVVIRPAVLNYAMSNPLMHVYIEGIDDINATYHQNELSTVAITNMAAGDYVLHVQIVDEFSGVIQKDAKFDLIKEARLYETTKFRVYRIIVIMCFVAYIVWIIARLNNMAVINSQYDQIKEAKDEAERANAAKSDFLAQMSHEIRTPINSVLGMDEMILREAHDPEILGYANDIYAAGRTLLSLINDILDQSKIESGKMEIVDVDYEIASLMNDLYNMVNQRAKVKGLELLIEVEEGMPIRYEGDDVRIRQVVVNLLTNAVKYTPAGTVWLRLHGTRKDDKHEILRFEVEDTGIGIKEEDLPHLFDEYQRFDDLKNRHIEGTGLGLAIARHLLELMGSELMVESTYGKGTKFYFDLEQEIMDETPIGDFNERMNELNAAGSIVKTGQAFIAPDAKILVVDDNAMNRRVFKSLLKHTKIQITEAAGGMESVELSKKEKYDIIFMDHMMPEVDGIDALHLIREDADNPNKDAPIVVLTANAVTGAKEMYLEEGFNGFLSKPVAGEKLEKTIRHTLPDDMLRPAPAEDRKAGMVAESGAEQPDDLPDVEGLDWSFAWLHLPERELLEETVREFYELIPVHADKLDGMYATILTVRDALDNGAPVPPEEPIRDLGDIPDNLPDPLDDAFDAYRIQVHGMKSAAATIGIVPLAGMAKMLEFAARDHDMSVIDSMHNIFIDEWRRYHEKMTGVFGLGLDADEEKEEAAPGMLLGYAMMLRTAMADMDIDSADEIMGKLKHLKFKEEIEALIPQLNMAVADINEDEVDRILTEMEEYDK